MKFPISLATPVTDADPLPPAADVVVIGGGIIGVMTAWYLARACNRINRSGAQNPPRTSADASAQQGAPGHDLARFRFGRFSDRSKIDLGPAL